MADIRDYLKISSSANLINNIFTTPENFSKNYWNVVELERKSFLRYYIVNNTPFLFKEAPFLFEQLTQYLADKLQINSSEIKLIGSAKTGFSISPPPDYGKPFGSHSDLDFSIVNEHFFDLIKTEYSNWSEKYLSKELIPKNANQEYYWNANLETGKNQIKRGFIDTNKIPNYSMFEHTQKLNNSLSLITINLSKMHSIVITHCTGSIYKNWSSFASRLKHNTESILRKLK